MTSKPVALLLADLGVTKTHSRPHVSDDNPFSEAQFKTLKYRPDFPERFGAIQDARAYCHGFFPWYNTEHRHGGLGLLTPHDVHYGLAEQRVAARAAVLARPTPRILNASPPACPTRRRALWRYGSIRPARPLLRRSDHPAPNLRRPGRDRHRERAAVQGAGGRATGT